MSTGQNLKLNQSMVCPLPSNSSKIQSPLSDAVNQYSMETVSLSEENHLPDKTLDLSSSWNTSTSTSNEMVTPLDMETSKPAKPVGRLQRWKYCLLGQPKGTRIEKDPQTNQYHLVTPGDTGQQHVEPVFVSKSHYGSPALEQDQLESGEISQKVSDIRSFSPVSSSNKEQCVKSHSRDQAPELNDLNDQTSNDKTDLPKENANNPDYTEYDCRICHGGTSSGKLVSPCYCTGTMGKMHAACLEQWLSSNGRKDCELCGYRYHLCQEPRSFLEFLKNPGAPNLARHLKCDLFCFIVLTPTTLISVGLLLFAANLLEWQMTWSVVGLVSTAIFLLMIYVFWSVMAFTYQRKIWLKWKQTHQVVRLKCTSKCDWDYQDSHPETTSSPPSLSDIQLHVPTSTIASSEARSDAVTWLSDLQFKNPDAPEATSISLEPYRFSQSYSDIRAVLPSSSSSSSCTFSSEPSLILESESPETFSSTRLPKNVLQSENIPKK